jgi:hypothetical protein
MLEFFSWIRFIEFDENYTILIDYEARASNKGKNEVENDDEG